MEASELRINNVYEIAGEVKPLTEDGLLYALQNNQYYDGFKPVGLSPEILEACGFNYHHTYQEFKPIYYNPKMGFLDWENDECSLCWQTGYSISKPFKHLHQLQNLYWCLCGQELEIKLPLNPPKETPTDEST